MEQLCSFSKKDSWILSKVYIQELGNVGASGMVQFPLAVCWRMHWVETRGKIRSTELSFVDGDTLWRRNWENLAIKRVERIRSSIDSNRGPATCDPKL